jgi:hypothetical protein
MFPTYFIFNMKPIYAWSSLSCLLALLVGCAASSPATVEPADELTSRIAPWVQPNGAGLPPVQWEHFRLPGKRPSTFDFVHEEGRAAIAAKANSSASMLRQLTRVVPGDLGKIRFSWKLPELIQYADMSLREFDDSPVRVVLAFEGDRAKFSPKNAMLSELAHLLSGEPLPYATLMYVWCNECEPDKVILNPHTDRIRKLPLESGAGKLNRWMDYERSVRADFIKAFGEEPGALTSISIMTDTDNTQSVARAWYGPIALVPAGR